MLQYIKKHTETRTRDSIEEQVTLALISNMYCKYLKDQKASLVLKRKE